MTTTADPTKKTTSIEAADEATPLLNAPESGISRAANGHATVPDANPKPGDHGTISPEEEEEKPMPYGQILWLCYASLAEPVAYFAIFPFINEMIHINGSLPEENVGFWSGMIESLFSLVQMVLMIFYGRMADRLGRKPVLVFSLAGVSGATALFGLSKALWQMIALRCLAGVFAGSVVTVRTMISENTERKTQGRAFSWYAFTRNLGIFIGPLIGGSLANPAKQYPGAFGHVELFVKYPYALATFAAGGICLSATLTSLIFLNETLVGKEAGVSKTPPMSTWEVLKAPGVGIVLFIFGHTMLLALAFTAVSPVFLFTSVERGGLSFDPTQISYYLAGAGASQALWMLLAFPPLQRRLGSGNLFRVCAVVWPLFMAAYPVANELARRDHWTALYVLLVPMLIGGSGVAMAFTCCQLFINDISPSPTVLATVNALCLTVNSAVRAVAPALFTSIYAFGVKTRWADGHLAWILLTVIAAALNIAIRFLPEAAEGKLDTKKPSRPGSQDHDSDIDA